MRLSKVALLVLAPLVVSAWQTEPSAFHISIIDGEGALNNVQGRLAREPVIQVEDRNHRRVAGAYVVFDTPTTGPSATFADGSTHFAVTTGADGRAAVSGMQNNGVAGSFNVRVHVFVQGKEVGQLTIHQSNVPAKVAHVSENLQPSNGGQVAEVAAIAGVLGVALGEEFLLDGSPVHGNSNLQFGSRIAAGAHPVALYVRGGGEFVVGPNSSVVLVQPNLVTVETGSARARRFSNWKLGHGGVWLTGLDENSDGVISLSGKTLIVASISGTVQAQNAAGVLLETLSTGSVFTFGVTGAVSGAGAAAAAAGLTTTQVMLIGGGAAGLLVGLGLAMDVNTPAPPTSP